MGTKIEVIFSTGDDFLAKFSNGKGFQWGCEKGVQKSSNQECRQIFVGELTFYEI